MSRLDGTGAEKRLPKETHTDKALQLQCLLRYQRFTDGEENE